VKAAGAALGVLAAVAVAAPWPFGSVQPEVERAISVVLLVASLMCALGGLLHGGIELPGIALWPLVGILVLGALQLVPLPPLLHHVAPGSRVVWHPQEPAAAAILGGGPHPVSLDPEATRAWLGLALGLVTLCLLAAPAAAGRSVAARAATGAMLGGLLVCVYGIVARVAFGSLLYGSIPVPTVSPFGPFVSKNHFAGYVEMAALLALGFAAGLGDCERSSSGALSWAGSPRAWRVLAGFGIALAMALGVLASLSRGGALSLLAGGIVFLLARKRARRHRPGESWMGHTLWLAAAVVLSVGVVLVLPREARERIGTLREAAGEQAASFRLRVWRAVVRMSLASPLVGHGMGSFETAFPRYKTSDGELRVQHAENDYLEMLAEGGLLGLVLSVSACGLVLHRVMAGLSRQGDRLVRGIGTGALAATAALLVHSAFDFNLRIPSNATLFALLAALALGAGGGELRRLERPAGFVLVAVPLFGLAATLWPRSPTPPTSGRDGLSIAYAIQDASGRALRLERADRVFVASVRRRPADAEAWVLLGWGRALAGRGDGLQLARYGASLDPSRRDLMRAVEGLAAATDGPR
jgi:O-antigen ligase